MNAEMSVLGCILLGDNQPEIFAEMTVDDFISIETKDLFIALRDAWKKYGRVDAGNVPSDMRTLAAQCSDFVKSLSGWQSYIETARRDAAIMRVKELAYGLTLSSDYEDVMTAVKRMGALSVCADKMRTYTMQEALNEFRKEQIRKPDYLKTGIAKLDRAAQIEAGDYVVIGARPSQGKTALALKIGRALAQSGKHVGFYSFETSLNKVAGRIVASYCRVGLYDIKMHNVMEREELLGLSDDLGDIPFSITPCSSENVSKIQANILQHGIEVAIIDYIGLLAKNEPGSSRFEQVTNASLAIRAMCQSTGVAAIVLAQVNRAGRDAPTMEDLKESGQIEQDADVILLLHSETDMKKTEPNKPTNLIIAKNKEGERGLIEMTFDGAHQDFFEVDERR